MLQRLALAILSCAAIASSSASVQCGDCGSCDCAPLAKQVGFLQYGVLDKLDDVERACSGHGYDDDDDDSSSLLSNHNDNDNDEDREYRKQAAQFIVAMKRRRHRQEIRCAALGRLWPASNECPPRELLESIVDGVAASVQDSPGVQVAYYSRVCGMFTYALGVRNQTTSAPMTDATAVKFVASKHLATLAQMHLLDRELAPLAYDQQLSTLFTTNELFDVDRITLNNVVVAPRATYAEWLSRQLDGTCEFGTIADDVAANFGTRFILPDNSAFVQGPDSQPEAQTKFLEALNERGPRRDQCLDPINGHVGVASAAFERATGKHFGRLVEELVLEERGAMCGGLHDTFYPSEGFAPESLGLSYDDDFSILYAGFNASRPHEPLTAFEPAAERNTYTATAAMGSARDLLRSWHGALENEYLSPSARQLFDTSFVRCQDLFYQTDDPLNCGIWSIFGGDAENSNYWGPNGFVRIDNATFLGATRLGQVTWIAAAASSFAVRYDHFGSYLAVTANGIGGAPFVLPAVLASLLPSIDPAASSVRFVPDSTSLLQQPQSLGANIGADESPATSSLFEHSVAARIEHMREHRESLIGDLVRKALDDDEFMRAAKYLAAQK